MTTMHHPAGSSAYRGIVASVTPEDLRPIMEQVGPTVQRLYPKGGDLLLARLENALEGRAIALTARDSVSGRPVALAAAVKKGRGSFKISTLWVSPFRRRAGVGTALMQGLATRLNSENAERAYVTARSGRCVGLEEMLSGFGFSAIAFVPNRYGAGRDEVVYGWNQETEHMHNENCVVLSA
jgi:ribosomal protein S18 acetylase RimI-like enzyme